ncbi:MAG: hypothetical protein O3A51_13445 [Verrucomicrobia bacterium]|nr:hypothetical protein [Verrucomicrobiota bacterium]
MKLVALVREDDVVSEAEEQAFKHESDWMVLARRWQDVAVLGADQRWQRPRSKVGSVLWTDDFSNVFGAIDWGSF